MFLGGWVKGQKLFGVYPYRLATFVFQVLLYYQSFMQFEFGVIRFLYFLLFDFFMGSFHRLLSIRAYFQVLGKV